MKHLPIVSGKNVSRAFKTYIKSALAHAPGPAVAALAADGWEIRLLPKAGLLFEPSLNVAASFAAASGTSFHKLRGATCMSGEHILAFFEAYTDDKGRSHTGPEAWIEPDQVLHEIGHALDRMQGENTFISVSDSPEFIEAYRKDVIGLNLQERKVFSYFLTGKPGDLTQDQYARREVVAESYAQALSYAPDISFPHPSHETLLGAWISGVWGSAGQTRPFREAFARSFAVVEKALVVPWMKMPEPAIQAGPPPAALT